MNNDYPVVDAHLDLAFDVVKKRDYGRTKVIETDYLPSLKAGGVRLVVSSIFVENQYMPEMALRMALDQVSALKTDIKESSEYLEFCTSYDAVQKAFQSGKVAIMLSFEDVMPLYNDMKLLPIFHELGVRILGLSWSRRNFACEGAHFKPVRKGKSGGLSNFGYCLVEEAERLGMLIDVSHINEEGFWDVIEISKKPVIASHSNVRALVNTERNLSDLQMKAIADRGGVIGINAMNFLVSEDLSCENVTGLCNHLDYMIQLIGPNCVGLGLDFNNQLLRYIPEEELALLPRKCYDVINGYDDIPLIALELQRKNYGDDVIKKVMGGNFLRVYQNIV